MSRRQPDPQPGAQPERTFIVAVLQQGADDDRELAEIEELAQTAGVQPVGRLVQHRARPDQRSYVGKGKLEELRQAFARGRGRVAARRRRADAAAAASARGRAQCARRRPGAADPRHLRPARVQRRGEAPGRAGPASVQPPADARHVGSTSSASASERAARVLADVAPERPSWRPTAGWRGAGSRSSSAAWRPSADSGRRGGRSGCVQRRRR